LEALHRTYGYEPVALTTCGPRQELTNGLAFCRIQSWLTGRRLVSLPFSDHCEPLFESGEHLNQLIAGIQELASSEGCKYAEIRPSSRLIGMPNQWQAHERYCLQRLDLRGGFENVSRHFHRSCVQRRIRHAVKEGVAIVQGRGSELEGIFYRLLLATRRRHGLPPQPKAWFHNLMRCLGESATIHCAMKDDQPIAAILTLEHNQTLLYKYGASLAQFHKLGAVPYLIGDAIRNAIIRGIEQLDFGRSSYEDKNLIMFKERWGAARFQMSYLRSPAVSEQASSESLWLRRVAKSACQHMPDRCLKALGSLAYRHIG
jgi:hypothetical protein